MLGWARRPNLRAARVPRQVLPQGAKTRVRGFADMQNFAPRARHSLIFKRLYCPLVEAARERVMAGCERPLG